MADQQHSFPSRKNPTDNSDKTVTWGVWDDGDIYVEVQHDSDGDPYAYFYLTPQDVEAMADAHSAWMEANR